MKIRYIGSGTNPASYQEYPVTGVNALWQPEQVSDVSDTRANLLIGTGRFVFDDDNGLSYAQRFSLASSLATSYGGLRTVILGDSRTQQNYDETATEIQGRPRWFNMLNSALGQPFELVANAAVNGERTDQILARFDSAGLGCGFGGIGSGGAAVTTNPGVSPFKPAVVFDYSGFNDIFSFGLSADTAWGYRLQILERIRHLGARLILMTINPPNSAAAGFSAARCRELTLFNEYTRNYARDNPGVILLDAYKACVDPASASIEGASTDFRDSVHETNLGALRIANLGAQVLAPFFPARDVLPASNAEAIALDSGIKQLISNPLLTGTAAIATTGFSGTTAGSQLSNGSFSRSGSMTCVLSAESRAIGATSYAPVKDGYGQNIRFQVTATAAGENIQLLLPSVHASVVSGESYYAVADVWMAKAFNNTNATPTALATADGCSLVQLSIQFTLDAVNNYTREMMYQSSDKGVYGVLHQSLKTLPRRVSFTSCTVARPVLNIYASAAGTFEVQIGRIGMYRV